MNEAVLLPALEWIGAALGLLGSALLAANTRLSGWGFVAYLMSNCCWIGFGLHHKAYGLLAMQIGYTVTSAFGVYRWMLRRRPALSSPMPANSRDAGQSAGGQS